MPVYKYKMPVIKSCAWCLF